MCTRACKESRFLFDAASEILRRNAFAVVIRRFNYGGHYWALMDTRQSTSNAEAFVIGDFSPCRPL